MPVPKRRTGKTKKRMRRSHHALSVPNLIKCPNCLESVPSHRVCPKCGHYKDRLILSTENE